MTNTPPPRPSPNPEPKPDPRDNCTTCGQPIEVTEPVWITTEGVDAGVEHGGCS